MFGELDEMEKHLLGVEEDDRPTTCKECGANSVDNINRMVQDGETIHKLMKRIKQLEAAGDSMQKILKDAATKAKVWPQGVPDAVSKPIDEWDKLRKDK